jgi:hypothetical protein
MRKLVAKVAALTLAAAGTLATAGPAAAAQGHPSAHPGQSTAVLVHGDGTNVTLSRSNVHEGRVAFKVDTTNSTPGGGSAITLFRLVGNTTLDTFRADLVDEFSSDPAVAARGTRELNRDFRAFGLADVVPGYPATVTELLSAGKYYLMDLGNVGNSPPKPTFTTFTVRPSGHDSSDRQGGSHGPVIKLTSADRFVSPGTLPARGTVTVKNVADTIHFMAIEPVLKGTTDAQVQAWFDSFVNGTPPPPGPPPFADGPTGGLDVLSPGHQAELTYNLPPGTYMLACFVADDVTGMPHAIMGMHKVVTLK